MTLTVTLSVHSLAAGRGYDYEVTDPVGLVVCEGWTKAATKRHAEKLALDHAERVLAARAERAKKVVAR